MFNFSCLQDYKRLRLTLRIVDSRKALKAIAIEMNFIL